MVDAEGGAGGDGARRKMDALAESALEIVPLELYDSARAKIAANLQWICAKAYGIGEAAAVRRVCAGGCSPPPLPSLPGVSESSPDRLCFIYQ